MKELTIEQKAKAYDMALDKIERLLDIGDNCSRKELEHIFPELKESEDERIRKALTDYFVRRKSAGDIDETWCGIPYDTIIAWLEKQGEHANFRNKIQVGDKVTRNEDGVLVNLSQLKRIAKKDEKQSKNDMGISEATKKKLEDNLNKALEKETPESCNKFLDEQNEPKFKVEKDKWYVCISQYCNCIEGRNYRASLDERIIDDYGTEYDIHDDAYKWFRPWTIQDAKDGDVLFTSSTASHETFIFKSIDERGNVECYFAYDSEDGFREGKYHFIGSAINCKPATKKQYDTLMKAMTDAGYTFDFEKKELKKIDKENLTEFEIAVKNVMEEAIEDGDTHNLKADAENLLRIAQPTWSEEDIRLLNNCISLIEDIDCTKEEQNFLKSLKERVQPQPKQEWSEEDEEILNTIINHFKIDIECTDEDDVVRWLKSLKARCTWKPSDEQMDALYTYIYNPQYFSSPDPRMELVELVYQDLKKLIGE